jgi:uncharacterized membrane protein YeaQ/YmgE (transglycosylase-associated protein family)
MTEPVATPLAGTLAASVSTVTLALIGVDHYSLIWALVGALLSLYQAEQMPRMRAMIFVILSTLIGAAFGTEVLAWIKSDSRPLLIVSSLVAGFGAQAIVTALLRRALDRIGVTKNDR